jgi:hypothetical protein
LEVTVEHKSDTEAQTVDFVAGDAIVLEHRGSARFWNKSPKHECLLSIFNVRLPALSSDYVSPHEQKKDEENDSDDDEEEEEEEEENSGKKAASTPQAAKPAAAAAAKPGEAGYRSTGTKLKTAAAPLAAAHTAAAPVAAAKTAAAPLAAASTATAPVAAAKTAAAPLAAPSAAGGASSGSVSALQEKHYQPGAAGEGMKRYFVHEYARRLAKNIEACYRGDDENSRHAASRLALVQFYHVIYTVPLDAVLNRLSEALDKASFSTSLRDDLISRIKGARNEIGEHPSKETVQAEMRKRVEEALCEVRSSSASVRSVRLPLLTCACCCCCYCCCCCAADWLRQTHHTDRLCVHLVGLPGRLSQ